MQLKRLKPSKGDVGIVGLAASVPFLIGATPADGGDIGQVITAALVAAGSAASGLVVKAGIVFVASFLRRKGKKMQKDQNPDNDELGGALEDAANRLDPEGK